MDNFEQLDKDGWKSLNIKFSRSKILTKENNIVVLIGLNPMVPIFEKENYFDKGLGKNCFLQSQTPPSHICI